MISKESKEIKYLLCDLLSDGIIKMAKTSETLNDRIKEITNKTKNPCEVALIYFDKYNENQLAIEIPGDNSFGIGKELVKIKLYTTNPDAICVASYLFAEKIIDNLLNKVSFIGENLEEFVEFSQEIDVNQIDFCKDCKYTSGEKGLDQHFYDEKSQKYCVKCSRPDNIAGEDKFFDYDGHCAHYVKE